MTNVNYPQPLSLKDDWEGWVVDYNIRARTNNKTTVIPRKFPENADNLFSTTSCASCAGHHDTDYYGWTRGGRVSTTDTSSPQDILPPTGFTEINTQDMSNYIGNTGVNNINNDIKNIRKTCVSPGIIKSLHPISDDSCMMVDRMIGKYGGNDTASNIFRSYAGNNASQGNSENLINSTTQIRDDSRNWDDNSDFLNNMDFVHNRRRFNNDKSYNTDVSSSPHETPNKWYESDMEVHSYIDVEKYNDDVYWNDYDIWNIKSLYKQNYNRGSYKDRKIWWDNLYNPYCHDLYEWLDTGLKSNETTRRMTCNYSSSTNAHVFDTIRATEGWVDHNRGS